MLYNDKETKEQEERFQELLAKTREYMNNHKEELLEQLNIITEKLAPILVDEEKSPEDLAFLAEIYPTIQTILQQIQDMQLIIGESVMRQSHAFYDVVKRLAAEGNEEAKTVYEDLKPSYEAVLRERIHPN